MLTSSVAHRLAHQAQRQGWNSASRRSAEAWVRFLATHRSHVRGRHREEEHRTYLSWESGPRNDVGAAMTPAPCL